ncbi:MAG: hypothetical protein AAGF12_12890 [Myxococcota bacterium]
MDDPTTPLFAIVDEAGMRYPTQAIPAWPSIELAEPFSGEPDPVALFVGEHPVPFDRPTAIDASRIELLRTDGTVRPSAPLRPGESYTLAIGAWAETERAGLPSSTILQVAERAFLTEAHASWPADGSSGVPSDIPLLALRLAPGSVLTPSLVDLVAGAETAPIDVAAGDCGRIGWRSPDPTAPDVCVDIRPTELLRENTEYELRLRADAQGIDATAPFSARFRTGAAPLLALAELTCALDELAVGQMCLLVQDHSARLRLRANVPFRAHLAVGPQRWGTVAPRGEAEFSIDRLEPGGQYLAELTLVSLAGEEQQFSIPIETHSTLLPLTISEVRANPTGAEPAQEYVELINFGREPADLYGLYLADRADRPGDRIDTSVVVPAAARVLLVAPGFDPNGPDDEPVPPGVALVRLSGSLGSGGLSNAGEPVFLRDAEGRRLAACPSLRAPSGRCLVRLRPDGRGDAEPLFAFDACTPGE